MYACEFYPGADRFLKKQSKADRKVFGDAIRMLQENPRGEHSIKMSGQGERYRMRVPGKSNWRILYEINDRRITITVVLIGDRKEVYKR